MICLKKWIAAGLIILISLCFHPFQAADAGELCVAETVIVENTGDNVEMWAAGVHGQGRTASDAAADMAQSAPGTLFLRQVKRVIFCGGAERSEEARSLPEEIPMGAVIYESQEPGWALSEELEELEEVLEARERREKEPATLAQIKNQVLLGRPVQAEPLEAGTE